MTSARSIPACAGEPFLSAAGKGGDTVYPRVCGGTRYLSANYTGANGLSPRVRGNRSVEAASAALLRSIPACAGEPSAPSFSKLISEVYPRVCGGTPQYRPHGSKRNGLSPRVRGNHGGEHTLHYQLRSIPACAGEPAADDCLERADEVYPRVCGGTPAARRPRT